MSTSQNGWPAAANLRTRLITPVKGVSFRIVDNANVATVFTYLVQQYDKRVEPVKGPVADDWGFAYRANVNSPNELSNHASGTAIDINATKHPNAVATSKTFTTKQVAAVHAILAELDHVVRWGGDYTHTVDAMHFEINVPPGGLAAIGKKLRTPKPKTRGKNVDAAIAALKKAKTATTKANQPVKHKRVVNALAWLKKITAK